MPLLTRRQSLLCALGGLLSFGVVWNDSALAQQPAKDPLAGRFGGPFTLQDHNGQSVTEKSYRGQFMLVYFGFTQCTDACPIDVPNLVQAVDLMKPLDAKIQPLFITVDPSDTVSDLKDYVSAFHPKLVGLTGTEAQLSAVAKAYRVHRLRVKHNAEASPLFTGPRHAVVRRSDAVAVHGDKPHSTSQRYSINHGTLTYLMGPDGAFLSIIPHNKSPQAIASVLRNYIQ